MTEPRDVIGYYLGIGEYREELAQLRDGTLRTLRVARAKVPPQVLPAGCLLAPESAPQPLAFLVQTPPPPGPTVVEWPLASLSSCFEGEGHDSKCDELGDSFTGHALGVAVMNPDRGIPPITLHLRPSGEVDCIADGWHRVATAKRLGHSHILARVRIATWHHIGAVE